MPANGDLYVFSSGETGDGDGEWVSPRPVDEVVVDVVTSETDLTADDIESLEAYVDRDDLAAHLDGEPEAEPLTFSVEGHDVVVEPDGTVHVGAA